MTRDAMPLLENLREAFGETAAAARAPGRVNLIGDHVDYCGGVVMPLAIDRDCVATIHPDATASDGICVASLLGGDDHVIGWDDICEPGRRAAKGSWQSYVLGVVAGLAERGSVEPLRGCRLAVATDVPLGAGLSSSAALEVSVAVAVASHCGISIEGIELAKLCQRAEHRFAGVPCGLMDQAISVLGREGHLVMLDCATEQTRAVPVPQACELVVVNSGVSHSLADGEYGKRRAVCEAVASELGIEQLAHAKIEAISDLDASVQPFARHVVTETHRVHRAAELLAAGDLRGCGLVMFESHASLRDDFKVSCPEIDAIVASLRGAGGVLGARMTGGGFGGCVVALIEPGTAEHVEAAVETCRGECPDLAVLPVQASRGAALLAR